MQPCVEQVVVADVIANVMAAAVDDFTVFAVGVAAVVAVVDG